MKMFKRLLFLAVAFSVFVILILTVDGELLSCQYCTVDAITCPTEPQNYSEAFAINYSYYSSSSDYPYDIRSLWVGGNQSSCVSDVAESQHCVLGNASFTTECPEGEATDWLGEVPISNVSYAVKCSASAVAGDEYCLNTDSSKTCYVSCRYTIGLQNLSYNVTAPSEFNNATCVLYLWYKTNSGQWCKILPSADICASTVYRVIQPSDGRVTQTNVPLNQLSIFSLENFIAPTTYMWTVECYIPYFSSAVAQSNWTFYPVTL